MEATAGSVALLIRRPTPQRRMKISKKDWERKERREEAFNNKTPISLAFVPWRKLFVKWGKSFTCIHLRVLLLTTAKKGINHNTTVHTTISHVPSLSKLNVHFHSQRTGQRLVQETFVVFNKTVDL